MNLGGIWKFGGGLMPDGKFTGGFLSEIVPITGLESFGLKSLTG